MASLLPWIFDGVILVFLIVCMVRGAKRGLILALCSLLAVFVAFAGASVAAKELSPHLSGALQPRIESAILSRLEGDYEAVSDPDQSPAPTAPQVTDPDAAIPEETQEGGSLDSVLDAIRGLGIYEGVVERIQAAVDDGFHQAAAQVAEAASAELADSIAYLVVFVAAFVVILLLWLLLSRALDLVARLPVLHTLNGLGGALLGLLKGVILLFVIVWVLQFFGGIFPETMVRQTVLLNFFLNTNPMSLLSGS